MRYLCVLALLIVTGSAMALEQPEYELVESFEDFELRRYPAYLVAETEVAGDFDRVGNAGFRRLADYIFGGNRTRTEVEATGEVSQSEVGSERIAMTAPVDQVPAEAEGVYLVRFVMPRKYSLESLPEPLDDRVRLRELPARLMAARRYSGRWTESNYRDNEAALLAALAVEGWQAAGPPIYARYNSPISLWFVRRNEVMVEVVQAAAEATEAASDEGQSKP